MEEKTLVILAAGMGSRFGGMKQTEPVGPNGEFIMDYSIYSAIRYGFNKVVFVIREEFLELFQNSIGKRLEGKIKIEYAFQKLEDVPSGFSVPEGREKPWGTSHALYSAREYINSNFAEINADDFYGDEAFKELAEHLSTSDHYAIVGYKVGDTLSENGAVKRGVILHEDGIVHSIIESSCYKEGNVVKCDPVDETKESFTIELDHPVSMLMLGFTPSVLTSIGENMEDAFRNHQDKLLQFEMYLTDTLDTAIKEGIEVDVIPTKSVWMGMTYREDKKVLQDFIQNEIKKGVYPENLWD